jgi:hypothetical protein
MFYQALLDEAGQTLLVFHDQDFHLAGPFSVVPAAWRGTVFDNKIMALSGCVQVRCLRCTGNVTPGREINMQVRCSQ